MDKDDIKRMITAFVVCMVIMLGWQYFAGDKNKLAPPSPDSQATPAQDGEPLSGVSETPEPVKSAAPAEIKAATGTNWRVMPVETTDLELLIGSRIKETGGYKAEIQLDNATASVRQVMLSEYKWKVTDKETGYPLLNPAQTGRGREVLSFMFGTMKLKGRSEVFDLSKGVWQVTDSSDDETVTVTYTASIVDENANSMLDVIKEYSYQRDNYEMGFDIRFVNHSDEPIEVSELEFIGPVGPLREDPRTDLRAVTAAYLSGSGTLKTERTMLSKVSPGEAIDPVEKPADAVEMNWFAVSNKFFAAVMRPQPVESAQHVDYLAGKMLRIVPLYLPDDGLARIEAKIDSFSEVTKVITPEPLTAGDSINYNFKVYLGAIDKRIFDEPYYANLGYEHLIQASSCFCALDWITVVILGLMNSIYALIHNYGVAVIVLVLLMRLVLHPITKKSQISMSKMGKIQPMIKELNDKYGNNKAELNRRTMELYKEYGLSQSMLLGCLPMFLQMPIWISLYTAVNSNVALRHQGLFPASWHWLNDLSAPDRLIPFSAFGVTSPIDIPMIGPIDAINLLPMLLCVAMYLQMKLSPQAAMGGSNPQAAQQQAMMKYMMPVMMLLFLYTAPSGLNLYIMASTFAGVYEQKRIRKHIEQQDAAAVVGTVATTAKVGNKLGEKKKKPRPPIRYQ